MKNLEVISEELFNKVRGRFPTVTIGNSEGVVTNEPKEARFFDFDFKEGAKSLGKVSLSLDEKSISVLYSNNFVEGQDAITKRKWYDFLKELRYFAKKRLLNFDTRDITKSNLDKRDYKFLAQNKSGEETMTESTLYGTSRSSYQDIGTARVALKHSKAVNTELASGRTQHVESIYIESSEGERFKYPFKHLNGARAMARHVAEGGKVYDDFGKHITGLSEELYKLKKFKSYMNRSGVMAEGLAQYMDIINSRVNSVKKTVESLQKTKPYKEMLENFEVKEKKEVPQDVAENWIDQLTIKQFNEELKDVFPYIYNLVNEETQVEELGPEDIDNAVESQEDHDKEIHDDFNTFEEWAEETVDSALEENEQRCCGDCGCIEYRADPKCHCQNDSSDHSGPHWIPISQYHQQMEGVKTPGDSHYNKERAMELLKKKGISNPSYGELMAAIKQIEMGENLDEESRMRMADLADIDKAWPKISQLKMKLHDQGMEPEDAQDAAAEKLGYDPEMVDHYLQYKFGEDDTDEGNKFTMALKKAKDNDDDEMDVDGKKIPVTEFILSMYDRENGQFPKGETAVLTAVEKDYGEQYIAPAKQFIEAIHAKFEEFHGYKDPEIMDNQAPEELEDIRHLAGI